jgi:hypothetical protein
VRGGPREESLFLATNEYQIDYWVTKCTQLLITAPENAMQITNAFNYGSEHLEYVMLPSSLLSFVLERLRCQYIRREHEPDL